MARISDEDLLELDVYTYRALDPHRFYENRAALLASKAVGIERLAYRIFGYGFIGSIAFALDTNRPFHADGRPRSDKTRLRVKNKPSYTRRRQNKTVSIVGSVIHFSTGDVTTSSKPRTTVDSSTLAPFQLLSDYSIDTTDRLRFKWETGGVFEKYTSRVTSTGASYSYRQKSRSQSDNSCKHGIYPFTQGYKTESYAMTGPFALMSVADQQILLNLEKANAQAKFEEYKDRFLSRSLPSSPMFNLFRSLAELKDLNRLADLIDLPRKLKERVFQLKDLGGLHLGVEFGVKPLLSDIQQMLLLPDRISKRLNYLIERNGRPTTFYQKVNIVEPIDYTPNWSTLGSTDPGAILESSGSSGTRKIELRSAINSTIALPKVELPQLRKSVSRKLWGIEPTLSDLYELTPWSWLVDWFTGIGNYLQALERITTDKSLIHDGWISYISDCKITHHLFQKKTWTNTVEYTPSGVLIADDREIVSNPTTTFEYTFHKRVPYSDIGVSTVNGLLNLNSYQSLILGALVAQKST